MKKSEFFTAFFIAKKNVLKNGRSLFLTVLIISLGFLSSIIIYGVLQNVSYNLQENFIETTMGHVILEPYDDDKRLENVGGIIKKISILPDVLGVVGVNKEAVRLYDSSGDFVDSLVYVVNPRDFERVSVVDDIITEGDWLNKGEVGGIVMGCVNIGSCNRVEAFDTIDVRVGEKVDSVFSGYPEISLTLKGIYDHKFIDIEMISYINEDTAFAIFEDYDIDEADQIIVRLPDRSYSDDLVSELIEMNIDAKISTWKEESSKLSSTVDSFSVIGNISFFLGLLISAISIYVILYINILNKKTQIGIIKAIGIKSKVVALSYVMLSFFLGVVGSAFGILLTLFMVECFKFYPIVTGIGNLVPQVGVDVFVLVSVAIILASIASGYIVSKKITKQNIIEAISRG